MPQPSHSSIDITTAAAVSGIVATLVTVLRFVPLTRRWLHQRELQRVRRLVEEAFAEELRRGEQTAGEMLSMHERLDGLEQSMAHNAELLEGIPLLAHDVAEVKGDVRELRDDIKLVLQQLGQVQGRSHFPPLVPGPDR